MKKIILLVMFLFIISIVNARIITDEDSYADEITGKISIPALSLVGGTFVNPSSTETYKLILDYASDCRGVKDTKVVWSVVNPRNFKSYAKVIEMKQPNELGTIGGSYYSYILVKYPSDEGEVKVSAYYSCYKGVKEKQYQ